MPEIGTSGSMSEDEKRSDATWPQRPRSSSTLPERRSRGPTPTSVWRGADGMLHFVDRKKNIIRRSGENIAAAEVEAVLLTHPDVQQAAVMAVKDELREEEVFACVVL